MKLVILESPYRGTGETPEAVAEGTAANVAYARECIRDCLARGEAPIASHLLFTQPGILDDTKPDERTLGIAAGHAWYRAATACVVYTDHGISEGMKAGVAVARGKRVKIEYRSLIFEAIAEAAE